MTSADIVPMIIGDILCLFMGVLGAVIADKMANRDRSK